VLGASVYAELPDQIESVLSTDISDGALAVAEQNLTTFVGSSELFRTMKSDMLAEPAVVEYVE
jgi:methylase of polypeptide subunit release factors